MKPEDEVCSINYINEPAVDRVRKEMLSAQKAKDLADLFKAMGDPNRVRILYALSKAELCVCDLSALLNMSQSAVSHQLRLLRNMRLVKYRRQGRMVFYSLDDDHIYRLFAEGLNHIDHD